jgi:hypothetical protein
LPRGGSRVAGDPDVVAELRQAIARHLDQPAIGAKVAREREALAVEVRLAAARGDEAQLGPVEHGEPGRVPSDARVALGEPQRHRAARRELAFAAADGERVDLQPVALQGRAQRAVPEEHAVGRQLERQRFAAQFAAQQRLAERAARLQLGAQLAFQPAVLQQRSRKQAHVGERRCVLRAPAASSRRWRSLRHRRPG